MEKSKLEIGKQFLIKHDLYNFFRTIHIEEEWKREGKITIDVKELENNIIIGTRNISYSTGYMLIFKLSKKVNIQPKDIRVYLFYLLLYIQSIN